MPEALAEEIRTLLEDGLVVLSKGSKIEVCSTTVEWVARGGKLVPRVTVVIEPATEP